MRWVTLALLALLMAVQGGLWLGRASVPEVMALRSQLQAQQATNTAAGVRNARLAAEVNDLKEGLEMVEEKARADLGMLRPDEILVQVTQRNTKPP